MLTAVRYMRERARTLSSRREKVATHLDLKSRTLLRKMMFSPLNSMVVA